MASRRDDVLGRIAVERGLLTEQQLRDCKRAQLVLPTDPNQTIGRGQLKPLSAVLLERQLITPEQLTQLLEEQTRRSAISDRYERMVKAELPLGQRLVKDNKATQIQINKCLEIQRTLVNQGKADIPPLKTLLVEQGFVDSRTMDEAMSHLEAGHLFCTNCGKHFSVIGIESGKTYKCKSCGGIMMTRSMLDSLPADESATFSFELPTEETPPEETPR